MFALTEALMLAVMLSPLFAVILGACYAIDRYNARPRRRRYR